MPGGMRAGSAVDIMASRASSIDSRESRRDRGCLDNPRRGHSDRDGPSWPMVQEGRRRRHRPQRPSLPMVHADLRLLRKVAAITGPSSRTQRSVDAGSMISPVVVMDPGFGFAAPGW